VGWCELSAADWAQLGARQVGARPNWTPVTIGRECGKIKKLSPYIRPEGLG